MAVTHAGRFERESSIEGLGADIAIGHLEVRDLRAITRGQAAADGLLDRHCRREAVGAGLAVQQDGDLIEAVFFVAGHGEEAIPLLKHDAQERGILVSGTMEDSPAARAGFQSGDIFKSGFHFLILVKEFCS